jgi:metacaspase-1
MARKALLAGINNYHSINGLNGCINDISNIRDILKTFFKFENSDIRLLADSRATDDAILDRFGNMVQSSKSGDKLIFHFSGHGSHIRDRDGDELKDSEDELICPYNMNWDGNYILDDDLAKIIKQLPQGVELEVLLDCCHSGTGTRGPLNLIGCEEHPRLSRYAPPPMDIAARSDGEELKRNKLFDCVKTKSDDRLIVAMNHVLWAGCKSSQTSADAYIKGSYNGAFTYYLCKHIRDANGKITRPELLKRIRQSLKYGEFDQVVQLETNKSRYYGEIFS